MTFTAARRTRRWTARITGTGDARGPGQYSARLLGRRLLPAALALLPAFLLGCEESDVTCPEGSLLTLTANPTTLNAQAGTPQSRITARLTNAIGVELPGQTVVFNTSEGQLTPPGLTPIGTDSFGIAESDLVTFRNATVDARCGTATDTVSVTVVQGDLADILLLSADPILDSCSQSLFFTARAVDTQGGPIEGLTIRFELRDENGTPGTMGGFAGVFLPNVGTSEVGTGEVRTEFEPNPQSCQDNCGGGMVCRASVVAIAQTGLESDHVEIIDNVTQ